MHVALVGGEVAISPDHAPPRKVAPKFSQIRTDRTGRPSAAGPSGHLSIGDDLARRQVDDDRPDVIL